MNQKSLESVHTILEDKNNYYWLSTNNGLFQARKKNLINYILKKDSTIFFYRFDKKDGLLTNEFNGGSVNCGVRLPNGSLVFPTINGIVFVDVSNIKNILPDNSLYIDMAEVDGKIIDAHNIRLKRDFYNLLIRIDCPYYGNPDNLYLEYSLDDTKKWIPLQNRTISVSGLTYGDHKIYVRKLRNFESSYNYKKIDIYVEPWFWEQLWFKLFCLLFLGVLVMFFIRLRVAHIRMENVKLNRKIVVHTAKQNETIKSLISTRKELDVQIDNQKKLIQAVTHDIKGPLSFLKIGTRYLVENNKNHDEDFNLTLRSVYETLFQTYNFVENLLNYNKAFLFRENEKKKFIDVQIIYNEKILLFSKIAFFRNVRVVSLLNKPFNIYINSALLSIIIHNLIDNAIKNSGGGIVSLNALKHKSGFILCVEDKGKGMTQEEVDLYFGANVNPTNGTESSGLGVKIIKELLSFIGGEIVVSSEVGKGTKVELIFYEN